MRGSTKSSNDYDKVSTVKNPVAELPGLPIFSVIFTRRLVRGFPTYQTLLEIM